MNAKSLVLRAIRRGTVDRVPWVPFIGCHAGKLIGISADKYLKSADYMVAGLTEAIKRYKPDGIPVAFDLQLEAEVLGCDLIWAQENPPAVSSHPLEQGVSLSSLAIPAATEGRIKTVLDATRRLRSANPDLALYGLIAGPFTLAMHLAGTNVFMQLFEDPDGVHTLMAFCLSVARAMAGYYIDAGCDVIAVVDPMTSQIGPEQFTQFISPSATSLFNHIRSLGSIGSFFVCGQAQRNIEVMCQCRPENLSIDENIPLDYVRDICTKYGVSFGGNLQLTVVLLLGSIDDAKKNALTCLDIGGDTGFILSPGCDIPYATPPENIEAVTTMVHDEYARNIARTMATTESVMATLDMSQYGQLDKVIVDVITLDSESCAPCQYMVEAVSRIAPEFDGIVEWREHKIKYRESLVFMMSLMVKNIPTICIDGRITFVSRIPPKEELIIAIQKRINEKLKLKIQRKKPVVHILANNENDQHAVQKEVEQAIHELGAAVTVNIITDKKTIIEYGVINTPAVIIEKHEIKMEGAVPPSMIIKEWIKQAL